MSLPWRQRKTRLASLIGSNGDEVEDGTSIDRLMHGQSVIGKTGENPQDLIDPLTEAFE